MSRPSAAQLAYQRTELTAFIHFGMATFDGTEQGNLAVDAPALFNPTHLDASTVGQWVSALKGAGIDRPCWSPSIAPGSACGRQ